MVEQRRSSLRDALLSEHETEFASVLARVELDALRGEKAALGLTFELSGPWPPYDFVSPTPDDAAADEPTNA